MRRSCRKLTGLFLAEPSVPANVVTEVSAREQVHHQIQILAILEGVVHVDDEGILEHGENLAFVHDRFDAALGDDSCLGHLFHSVAHFNFFAVYLPHLAKASLANAVVVAKVVLRDGCQRR